MESTWQPRDVPERIVCLTEEFTEILYALGQQDRIVGISAYTERPPEARRDKPVVSAFIGGSVDKIQKLDPDLVIGFSDIQAELASELIEATEQVLIFNQRSIQQILDVIITVGRLVGVESRARSLVDEYIQHLEQVREASLEHPASRPKVYFEEWPDPAICGIRWVCQLIEIAGGDPVFSAKSQEPKAEGRFVDFDELADKAPDIIAASWCGKPVDIDSIAQREALKKVPAVEDAEIHEIDPAIILQPGPACLTDGLDRLHSIIRDWRDARHNQPTG